MTPKLLIVFLIVFSFSFCNNDNGGNQEKDLPTILSDDQTIMTHYSSDRYSIIDELYNHVLNQNEELAKLDKTIEDYFEILSKNTEAIEKFNDVNKKFFSEAKTISESIRDEKLKKEISERLNRNELNYDQLLLMSHSKLDRIDSLNTLINDYQHVLKLAVTLPIIQEFQNTKLPDIQMLDRIIEEQEAILGTQIIQFESDN